MKRLLLLLIILSIFGCEKQDNPVPRDNEPAGEEIKTVQLGENLVMQVGDKVRIKDTLYYQSAKTDSIVPVYLNYVLSLDSIKDARYTPCDTGIATDCWSIIKVVGYFHVNMPMSTINFDLELRKAATLCRRGYYPDCVKDFLTVCSPCTPPHKNLSPLGDIYSQDHSHHYINVIDNLGFCVALDSVYPTLPNEFSHSLPRDYSDYKFYIKILN